VFRMQGERINKAATSRPSWLGIGIYEASWQDAASVESNSE
jgi:hypothetical protein